MDIYRGGRDGGGGGSLPGRRENQAARNVRELLRHSPCLTSRGCQGVALVVIQVTMGGGTVLSARYLIEGYFVCLCLLELKEVIGGCDRWCMRICVVKTGIL